MSFNSLPNEIIYQISSRVQPADLEDYSRTNHRIQNIAAPFVQEHRQLKKKYTKTSLNHIDAAKLFYEICSRPWVALYPQHLEVKSNREWRTFENSRHRVRAAQVEEVMLKKSTTDVDDILCTIRRTGLIPESEIGVWVNGIDRGDEDYLFAIMLACLPNLERVIVRLDRIMLEQVKEMVRTIKRQPSSPYRPKALSKLRDTRVIEREGSNTCDLELFPLLASLPGIQILHGRNLVGMYRECYRDGWLSYPGASSTITHLSLETCGMSVEGLEKLCESLNTLRSFKYVAHRAGWGLRCIADVLKNAKGTLEELVLSTGAGNYRFIGTLRAFTSLRHLTVDSGMLMQRGKMSRAVDILPASIETATLAGNSLTRPHEEQFLADLYRPSFSFPKLRNLRVDDSWGLRDIGQDRLKFQQEFHKQATPAWMIRYR